MAEPLAIIIPLLNPNEPGALLAALHVHPGQHVNPGDKLCTLETTKSTQELAAEAGGYVTGLSYQAGQTAQAGDILCFIADSPHYTPPAQPADRSIRGSARPAGIRISQPALFLAQKHGLDLAELPADVFVTEKMVQDLLDSATKVKSVFQSQVYPPDSIIVYGGGGHGKALIDLIRILGTYSIAGIVDDGIPAGSTIMRVSVLGGAGVLEQLYDCGVHLAANAVGGIGNITTRIKVFERLLQVGFNCPTLVHPTAFIESSASLGEGVQVMPHAYIGSEARTGFGVIVNTGAIVSHDCTLGDYVNLSPGAILAGEVSIGDAALVGMGATINLRVRVGRQARIGNGATVKQDVPESAIVHAGSTWPE